jgi:plastocyanin
MKRFFLLWSVVFSLWCSISYSAEHTVVQKKKKFSEDYMILNVGDVVYFENADPFYHNVFSTSDITGFDLGSYRKGKSRSVIFDKPGLIEVECAIHPQMFLEIRVE